MPNVASLTYNNQSTSGKDVYGSVLVFIYLIGIYIYPVFRVTPEIPWAAPPASVAGILLLLKNSAAIERRHLTAMFLFIVVAVLSMVFAPSPIGLLGERSRSLLHLIHSFVICYGLYLELVCWRREEVARVFFVAAILIVVGCAMENYTPFKAVSDGFRQLVFPGLLHHGDVRDLTLFGILRPRLFTSEPSHLAKFFLLAVTVWLALSRSNFRFILYFSLLALGFFLIRSPILVLGVATAVAVSFLPARHDAGSAPVMPGSRILITGLIIVVGLVLVFAAATTIMSSRLDLIAAGRDQSFSVRMTGPMMIAWETVTRYPFFGAGIGGREAILDILMQVYMPLVHIENIYDNLQFKITNVFWVHWIFFGLVGGILAGLALLRIVRNLGSGAFLSPIVVILIFSQTMGAYVTPRLWTVVFVTLATTRLVALLQQDEIVLKIVNRTWGSDVVKE